LLNSLLILKIIIFYIFSRAFSVLTMSKLRVNAIIFVALILCILFVSFFFLIYVINFISLIDCRFKSAYLIFILIVVYAINNKYYVIFAYVLASCMSFFISFIFFS